MARWDDDEYEGQFSLSGEQAAPPEVQCEHDFSKGRTCLTCGYEAPETR